MEPFEHQRPTGAYRGRCFPYVLYLITAARTLWERLGGWTLAYASRVWYAAVTQGHCGPGEPGKAQSGT